MKLFVTLLVIVLGATSCTHIYYAPNSANVPLLSEKKETRVNALYCSGGETEFEGGELQVAAALTKNVAVMVNGMAMGKSESVSDYSGNSRHTESGNGSYIEVAGGMFESFGKKKKWIGEIYGGVGVGSAKNTYSNNLESKVNSTKLFLQASVGFKSRYFEFAFAPKISLINWNVKRDDLANVDQSHFNYYDELDLQVIKNKPNFVSFEPALLIRAGGEDFKIQAGLSFSNFTANNYLFDGLTETLNASLGISINLHPAKNK